MGGGPVHNTNLLVWGVDLVEEHLMTCAGIPARPPVAAKPLMYIAEYSINALKSGKIQHTDFLKVGSFTSESHEPQRFGCSCKYLPLGTISR